MDLDLGPLVSEATALPNEPHYGPIDVFTKKKAFGFNFIIVFVIGNNEQTFGEHFYLISAKISLFDICIQSFLYTLVSIVLYSNK